MGRIRPNCLHAKHGRGAAVGPVVGGMSRMLFDSGPNFGPGWSHHLVLS